jgi:hypothetical protein
MRDSILSLIMLIAFVTSTRAFAQQIHLPPMVQQGPNTSSVPIRTQEEVEQERVKRPTKCSDGNQAGHGEIGAINR